MIRVSTLSLIATVDTKQSYKPAGDYLLKRHDQATRQFYDSIRQLAEYRTRISFVFASNTRAPALIALDRLTRLISLKTN